MPQSHGFSAWIAIDTEDTKLPEFGIELENDAVTCWIPCEVGKRFSVHWSNLNVPGMSGGRVLVDGHNCDGQILARKRRPTSTHMTGLNEPTTVRPFIFDSMEVTEENTVPDLDPDLGTIVLEIWKVEKNDAGPSNWTGVAAPAPKKILERSKKAVTQQIGFCDSIDRQSVKFVSCRWTERIVTFSFKYRPLDLLRANGIVPPLDKGKRKASPAMSDEDDSDADEALQLETRLSEIRAKQALKNSRKRKFKVEEVGLIDLTRPKKRFKFENDGQGSSLGEFKIKAEVKTELIDLTQPRKRIKRESGPLVSIQAEIIDLT
ncbi:hypothetical protein MSAN_00073900 [Mycena sanguinolenta]|uniref:DUF7918 domain-containing protein n=1 Tax=Mycena sanguinolenta TaxID=230812 RepID=A0A8H6ZCL8_9AGAR|nr:hypothetical protein MSAN_00073900 [Mycena sanguinolenta]